MSLQGLPVPTNIPGASHGFSQFIYSVRMYIRDYPELNRLVAGEESSERQLAWAAIDAIEDFNGTPPNTGLYTFSDLMARGQASLLRKGTILNTLISVGLLQTRNHLPFSDGGLNVAVSDKTPLLQSWISIFQRQWEMGRDRVKVAWNIENFFGTGSGTHSEYFALSGYYHIDLTR
jgi:hypothetical protein